MGQLFRVRVRAGSGSSSAGLSPLPSRLASIARGTGEVDVTYHVAFDELRQAVDAVGGGSQRDEWEEVTGQGRLRDYNLMAQGLVDW
jgi:hypothetical protein